MTDLVTVVAGTVPTVTLIAGQQGLPGPPGAPGTGGAAYVHTQSVDSNSWVVNHNLGIRPAVEVLSPGGVRVGADVVHTSINQTVIGFALPTQGQAVFRP